MNVLGLVANTHDSGIALVQDGHVRYVLEEERFNRQKRTMAFPRQSLDALFAETGGSLADIDIIALPWSERVLRRTLLRELAPRLPHSLSLFHQRAHPAQRNQIVALSSSLRRYFRRAYGSSVAIPRMVGVGHHDAHAASFYVSPFEEALVLVMDGYGDDASSSAYVGRGNELDRVWSTGIFNSLGLVYTIVTDFLGFEGFGDEGKVMALAAYGSDRLVEKFRDVVHILDDGTYSVDMSYFSYDRYGQSRPLKPKFIDAFGAPRQRGEPMSDHHRDVARALQVVTEEVILALVRALLKKHPARNIVLSGGVALNCVANARVLEETGVERVWVPPCASDTGAPLGAALWHTHRTLGHPRRGELTHPYLGLAYSDAEMLQALTSAGLPCERMAQGDLIARVARDLEQGAVVGWYQGRFEMGPRALGNRSILADPRHAHMRDVINARIKKRESFRPFAPVVPIERAAEFFEISQPDPFMTLAPRVRPDKRALIPAAVHVDGTGRIQTIAESANPRYHALITEFGRLTGVPVLINTSFNEQEPIVARPAEAVACFTRTEMDVLVMGDFYTRRAQGT
ncbi:MAG: carbamoyltransferase [Hyphomicrobiales bacterium]|nr:carbamoyltransferase [Hyphomicrobiales bacterium]